MNTIEQQAAQFAKKYHHPDDISIATAAYLAGASAMNGSAGVHWTDASIKKPDFIVGQDFSKNVLAIVKGYESVQVMCLMFAEGEDETGDNVSGPVWANCYGDITGDGEWDDEYEVTHWMPLPNPPDESVSSPSPLEAETADKKRIAELEFSNLRLMENVKSLEDLLKIAKRVH